jgi:hypothetical protein
MHNTLSEIAGLAAFSIRYQPHGCMVILNCGLFHTDTRLAHRGPYRSAASILYWIQLCL